MFSIPAAHGPWPRQMLLEVLKNEVSQDLKVIRETAGIARIYEAESRITRALTVGPGTCLLTCSTESERLYFQATLDALQMLTRSLAGALAPATEEQP